MNTITIELSAEDRARLDRILAALEHTAPNAVTGLPEAQPVADERKAAEQPEEPEAAPWEVKEEPKADKPAVTLQALQALVQELAAPGTGKFDQVKRIVKHFAPKVSQIPESDWAACYEMLLALKEA